VTPLLLVPGLAAAAAGLGAGLAHRRVRPAVAARALAALAVVAFLGVLASAARVVFPFILEQPAVAARAGWCRSLLQDHRPPPLVGAGATAVLAAMAVGVVRFERRRRIELRCCSGDEPVEVVPSDEPLAFAVGGRRGRIIVSTGMLQGLRPDEQRALFAHEEAHLRRSHHRYVRLAGIAAAAVPFLRPLAAEVRYATERWADEDAAAAMGDRQVVARAIARAALAGVHSPSFAMGMATAGVVDRVEALLDERAEHGWVTVGAVGLAAGATIVAIASSALQLHHLLAFARHVCGLG
jgi:hypothetical protein